MLTPAEEMGLGGLSLASRVRKALYQLPEADLVALARRISEEALRRGVVYLREGVREAIHIMPCPVTVLPDQLSYIHFVSQTIHNALKRFPELYLQDFAVRDVLRLSPEEEDWLWRCWGPSQRENNPIFGRLDALVDFTSPIWKNSLRFMEPNMSGIGGLYLVPTSEHVIAKTVLPRLKAQDPDLNLELAPDIRELLMQAIR